MMKGVVVMLAILGMMGCENNGNSSGRILDKQKMQAVMWDIIGADVFTEQFVKKDSSKNPTMENIQLQNKIFAIHHVSRADYYKSYEYYLAHTDLMKTILDSMTAKGERDRMKIVEQHFDRNYLKKDSVARKDSTVRKDTVTSNNSVHRYAN
ncbi:MAG: hypothetical protein JWP81_1776 [Ferruginibacter sp.]|nr:hypothetical protein [Ferruginibacter sp.]